MAYKNKKDELEYYKKYYQKNKEKKLAYRKSYYEENKDVILKTRRENYIPHPNILKTKIEKLERDREWREKNREGRNAYMREWTRKNNERLSEYKKNYYHTRLSIRVQFTRLIAGAESRNYKVSISIEEFESIVRQPCIYCGENEKRIGIDRVDNSVGYTKKNSVPCCKICNRMKMTLSLNEFLGHIEKIYQHNKPI